MRIELVLVVIVALVLTGCGDEKIPWKQEVPLQDGRLLILDRLSNLGPKDPFLGGMRMELEQTLTFAHPDTGERIEWSIPKGLLPYMLDFEAGVPYYVMDAHTIADYNDWNCPNPPYMVFKYTEGQWRQIPFEELPARFVARNLFDMAKGEEKYIVNGYANRDALAPFLMKRRPDRRVINRQKIDANVHGCFPSVLMKLGRANEITEPIGIPTSAKGAQK